MNGNVACCDDAIGGQGIARREEAEEDDHVGMGETKSGTTEECGNSMEEDAVDARALSETAPSPTCTEGTVPRIPGLDGRGSLAFTTMLETLEELARYHHMWAFNAPVDYIALGLPDYPIIVERPMDLGTVIVRGKSDVYGEWELGTAVVPAMMLVDGQTTQHKGVGDGCGD